MRIVLDTNVFVSSYLSPAGPSARIMRAVRDGAVVPAVSAELLAEYARVLEYPRLVRLHQMTPARIGQELALFAGFTVPADLGDIPSVITEDPADDVILATAVAGAARYIVSGDQDLLRLGSYHGIQVLTPAGFLSLQE